MVPDIESDVFLAWAAGFVDGEGSIGIYSKNGSDFYYTNGVKRRRKTPSKASYILQMSAYQDHSTPLEMIKQVFGGTMCYRPSTRVWSIVMNGSRAANAIRAMLPYFVVKREEAELALEFQEFRDSIRPGHRELEQIEYSKKMKSLKNRKGNGKTAVSA